MPGQPLIDVIPGLLGMNANGNVFRLSKKKLWYRLKDDDLAANQEYREPVEGKWRDLGIVRRYPEPRLVPRFSVLQLEAQNQRLPTPATHNFKYLEQVQHVVERRGRRPFPPKKFPEEVDLPASEEYRPSPSWTEYVASYQHRLNARGLKREIRHNNNRVGDQCDCGCGAPRPPGAARDVGRTEAEPAAEELDRGAYDRAATALRHLASCRSWRGWLRGAAGAPPAQDAHALLNLVRDGRVGDLVDGGYIVGSLAVDGKRLDRLLIAGDDDALVAAKHAWLEEDDHRARRVWSAADRPPDLYDRNVRTLLNNLPGVGDLRDLLCVPEFADALTTMSGVVQPLAQLRHGLAL
jgi:hypothetical protein